MLLSSLVAGHDGFERIRSVLWWLPLRMRLAGNGVPQGFPSERRVSHGFVFRPGQIRVAFQVSRPPFCFFLFSQKSLCRHDFAASNKAFRTSANGISASTTVRLDTS